MSDEGSPISRSEFQAGLQRVLAAIERIAAPTSVPLTIPLEEAAAALGITLAVARRWCREGSFPGAFKPKGAKGWVVLRSQFEKEASERAAEAAAKRAERVQGDNPVTPHEIYVGGKSSQAHFSILLGREGFRQTKDFAGYVLCAENEIKTYRQIIRKAGLKLPTSEDFLANVASRGKHNER